MKKEVNYLLGICTFLFAISTLNVNASPGFLRKNSIKTCNDITYGQHSSDNHWHIATKNDDGGYNAVGDPIYTDPCGTSNYNGYENSQNNSNEYNTTPLKPQKSSDTSLKELKINNESITINDIMSYTTQNEQLTIEATANDEKAKIEYENNIKLSIGNNSYSIIVTAEDGSTKTYTLNITREKILSSNTNIEIKINNELIEFIDGKSTETIEISSDKNSLEIDYTLEDEYAKVDILNNDNLKVGNNKITVHVTAENGETKDYIILVKKSSKFEETVDIITGLGITSGIGYIIYRKKKK